MPVVSAHDANGGLIFFEVAGTGTETNPYKTLHSDIALQELVDLLIDRIPVGLSNGKLAVDFASGDALLTVIRDRLIEIASYTDTLEALIATLNSYTSGIQALLTTANTTSSSIGGFVDQLEGYTDGVEANQTLEIAAITEVRDRIPASGIASDANQLTAIARLVDLIAKLPNQVNNRIPTDSLVRNLKTKWREDFAGTALSGNWTSTLGAGQTISVANSVLTIAAGLSAGETIIRSVNSFTIPFRSIFYCSISQRILNQEIYLEIIDSSGGHYAHLKLDGTNNAIAFLNCANAGNTIGQSLFGLVYNATSFPQAFELEINSDEVGIYSRGVDNTVVRATGPSRNRQIPDPNLQYFIQIRVKNLASVSTSTNIAIDAIYTEAIEEVITKTSGGFGGSGANKSIPVSGTVAIAASSTVTTLATSQVMTTRQVVANTETIFPLGSGAVFIGNPKDSSLVTAGTAGYLPEVNGLCFTDVSGTILVEQSVDGSTNWIQTDSFAVPGSVAEGFKFPFRMALRRYRIKYLNGATAQTVLRIHTNQIG